MNAQSPRLSQVLGQVATTVKVKTSSLGLNRLDKNASTMADADHAARQGTGKVVVSRLSGAEHLVKAINSKANEATQALIAITTAYNGERLLPNSSLNQWLATYGAIKAEHTALVDHFKANAPQLIANAERNKGTYDVHAPSLAEIDEAFGLDFEMAQIPDSASYHGSGLDAAMNAELQRQFEASTEAAYTNAKLDAIRRVAKPLGHLIERLTVFSKGEDEKDRGVTTKSERLYESTITNVQDIASVLRSFNLTGETFMDELADKLDAFEGIEIEDIKSSKDLRTDLTKKAGDILESIKDLI